MEPVFDKGGRRNYRALSQEQKDAHDFIAWATAQGSQRETGSRVCWAAAAARHLQDTDPERFAKAVAAWKAGHPATYDTLVGIAEAAAGR
jgi:hypothetical protein